MPVTTMVAEGDYVLATKYHDGDHHDHWCIGIVRSVDDRGRVHVVDSDDMPFRGNGFRRAAKISAERGELILAAKDMIEHSSRSLWWWRRQPLAFLAQWAERKD